MNKIPEYLELPVGNELKGHDAINADELRKLKKYPLDIIERWFSL